MAGQERDRKDPNLLELYERVSRLESDVSWLKKIASTNLFISAAELVTILIMIAVLIFH